MNRESVVRDPIRFGGVDIHQGSTLKELMDCKPSKYRKGEHPLDCLCWIMKKDQTFWSGDFTEHRNINFVMRMFEGEALESWDTIDIRLTKVSHNAMTSTILRKKVDEWVV